MIRCSAPCDWLVLPDRRSLCMLEAGHAGGHYFEVPAYYVVCQLQRKFPMGLIHAGECVGVEPATLRFWLFGNDDPIFVKMLLRMKACVDWEQFCTMQSPLEFYDVDYKPYGEPTIYFRVCGESSVPMVSVTTLAELEAGLCA